MMKNKRTCVVTKKSADKKDLLRIVKTKDDKIIFDKDNNVEGRGCYFEPDIDIIKKGFSQKVLNRSFRQKINNEIYNNLLEEVSEWLKRKKK